MIIDLNIEEIKSLIKSDKFIQFLLNNTTEFSTAAWILQTLNEELDNMKKANSTDREDVPWSWED